MDKPPLPLVVSPTVIQDTLFAALRVISVLIGGGTAIIGFLGKHDLNGLVAYIRSDDFTPVAGALAAVFSLGYGLWMTYRRKSALIVTAQAAPNSVAIVSKGPTNRA